MKDIPLFPNKSRKIGLLFIVVGVFLGYLYFFGGKPDFFVSRIFAVVTSYLETRYFVAAQTNLLDEIAALFFISGLSVLSFSKEKTETDQLTYLRFKALVHSAYFTLVVWFLAIFFIYGWAIFIFSTFVFIIFLLAYLAIFKFFLFKVQKEFNSTETNYLKHSDL